MTLRLLRTLLLCGLVCVFALPASSQPTAKRPITHADYGLFPSIQSPALSPDGNLLVYAVGPQEGDGEVIVRHLTTGKEFRHPRGSRPVVATLPAGGRGGRGGAVPDQSERHFSPDSQFVVFPLYPPRDKSKGKAAAVTATAALGIMEASSGKVTRLERVRNYQMPESGPAWLAYHKAAPPAKIDPDKTDKTPGKTKGGAKGATPSGDTPAPVVAAELVLRNLVDGKERTFADVTDYTLAKDGRCLIFSVQSKKEEDSGIYAVTPGQEMSPVVIRSGAGRYNRLTWDEKQSQMVFYHSVTPKPAKEGEPPPRAQVRLYRWVRPATGTASAPMPPASAALAGLTAVALQAATTTPAIELTAEKPAFQPGCTITDQATLTFSQDGGRVYFSVTAPAAPKTATEGKANVELWHHNDDFIQPMQKSRYSAAPKTYRAVFHVTDRTSRQLGDEALADVTPSLAGDWAVGRDDRTYRRLVGSEESGSPADLYLVNQKTGEKKLVEKKIGSTTAISPAGKYLLSFDGKDWNALAIASGKRINLTKDLKVRFDNELNDTPGAAPPYGFAGWTKDDQHVLIYDRYDIWMMAADGSSAKNLTGGLGRKNTTQLRVVRLETRQRHFDTSKPLLLRAENESTRDTGFYRVGFDNGEPKLLIMGARNYSIVGKAAKGDRLLLTISTFYDAPDLYTADLDFKEIKRVSDANPEKAKFIWGKAELIKFKDSDGEPLSGILIKPENFDPKKKYPMIVYIYERLSQNLHNFVRPNAGTSINSTYYASNGYLVLMPDIRYTVGHPGQSAVKCVLPAIQAVVDKGFVDEKAIGIQGHSWGGYQTAYLITQTTRFAAASAGAPVSNMTSAYGGIRWGTGLPRQFQYEKTQSRIGATPWQARDKYLENSPLFHADRIKTPLIMLHNDQDEAVPWQQGIEYYLALRRLGKEVYLFNYRGEGHGLRQRVNQMDYTVRMQQFFDHHLKAAKMPEWMEKGMPYAPPPSQSETPRTTTGRPRKG